MGVRYYKRYRMEFDLARPIPAVPACHDYGFMAWSPALLEWHAETKYRSFVGELDAMVFPCLGEEAGCLQLMHEIAERPGFIPEATWLAVHAVASSGEPTGCGTIQGVCMRDGWGGIQNVGTVPEHRGRGIAAGLVTRALAGFRQVGLRRVHLEVTAQNARAVRLYTRLGFRHVRTIFKAVEAAYS